MLTGVHFLLTYACNYECDHCFLYCGPLSRGGPVALAKEYGVELDAEFVDECHYCTLVRRALIDRFPQYLAPRQVYGLEEN